MNFSVLISVYIKENPIYLKQALESIWDNQNLKPNEIVIVKDGPLNISLNEVLDEFAEKAPVKFLEFQNNLGLGEALNKGLEICKYDIIARMDTDDISHPNRFSKQIAFLFKNKKVDIVGAWIDEFTGNKNNIISTRKVPEEHSAIISYLKGRCPLNHPTVVFRKKAVVYSGNYLECHLKEDLYLWLRLYKNNFVFANIPESLLYFRTNDDVFKRRGGINYAKSELRMFNFRYQIGLINIYEYIYFTALTIPIRLAPPLVRSFVYKRLLR